MILLTSISLSYLLLDDLFEVGVVRGSKIEAATVEFYYFIREQRQGVENASRSRAPINSVLAFCNQSGFRSRSKLSKVSFSWVFESYKSFSDGAHLPFSGLPIDNTCAEGSVGVASYLYGVSQCGCN